MQTTTLLINQKKPLQENACQENACLLEISVISAFYLSADMSNLAGRSPKTESQALRDLSGKIFRWAKEQSQLLPTFQGS